MKQLIRLSVAASLVAQGYAVAGSREQAPGTTGPTTPPDAVLELLSDSYDDWTNQWMKRRFRRRKPTRYTIIGENGGLVLRGRSAASASAMWRKLDLEDIEAGQLSWRWKVERSLPDNEKERVVPGDDYTARVFVFFGPKLFSRKTRAICYVWASSEPVGSVYPNPYSKRIATFVLESGDARAGEWISETRDIVADYRRAFAKGPTEIAAVAFMVDTDDTGIEATAWFDDLVLDLGPDSGLRAKNR